MFILLPSARVGHTLTRGEQMNN